MKKIYGNGRFATRLEELGRTFVAVCDCHEGKYKESRGPGTDCYTESDDKETCVYCGRYVKWVLEVGKVLEGSGCEFDLCHDDIYKISFGGGSSLGGFE